MSLDKLKKKYSSYKRLLEADTLGSFDFFTCIVCLDSVESSGFEAFKKALTSKNYPILSKILPLVIHEFTHFIDSTSTVWGMNHLKKMNEAYCSNDIKGGTESEFYKAKYFLDHARSLRLPKYYTVIDSNKKSTRPWKYRITIGKHFGLDGKLSDNPILFSHFLNLNGEMLVRSPVSTVSILEASAMSNEIVMRKALINELDESERVVENNMYQQEVFKYIYDQNITEYSVCVHIVANHLLCQNIFDAFQICSIITRLVLNFPRSLLDTVLEVNICNALKIPEDKEFESIMKNGIKNHNLGILFYLICKALPKDTAESQAKMVAGIGIALSKIGLSLDLINKESTKEIEVIAGELNKSKLKAIQILSKSGVDNFTKIPLTSMYLNPSELSLPSVYLGDGKKVSIPMNENSLFKTVDIEEIFNELYEGQEWVERFSEACTV